MTREELEKYISELSPEMQEKARQCKTMEELQAMLAENDVELSEDALEAVAGGCSAADVYKQGTIFKGECPHCGGDLKYHDTCYNERGIDDYVIRANCVNGAGLYYKQIKTSKWYKW